MDVIINNLRADQAFSRVENMGDAKSCGRAATFRAEHHTILGLNKEDNCSVHRGGAGAPTVL